MDTAADTVYALAIPMVVIGLGHKLDKVAKIGHMAAKGLEAAATQLDKAVTEAPK
jgi:hypothetical protein